MKQESGARGVSAAAESQEKRREKKGEKKKCGSDHQLAFEGDRRAPRFRGLEGRFVSPPNLGVHLGGLSEV